MGTIQSSNISSVASQVANQMQVAFKPNSSYLLNEAQKSTQSVRVESVIALFNEGVYLADLLKEDTPQYTKASVANGKITVTGFELTDAGWKERSEDGDYEYVLTKDGWKEDNGCVNGPIKDTGPAKAELTCIDGSMATMSVKTLDITDKSLAALGQSAPDTFKNFSFPKDSKVHLTVFTNLTDAYQIWGGSPVTGPNNAELSDISSFISAYATGNPGIRFYPDRDSSFSFTFDVSDTNAKSGAVSLWPLCTAAGNTPCDPSLGKATYEIKKVHNQDLLIVRIKPMEEAPGNFLLFGVRDGKLYSGVYRPAFTGSVTDGFLNKTAINAILNQVKWPPIK